MNMFIRYTFVSDYFCSSEHSVSEYFQSRLSYAVWTDGITAAFYANHKVSGPEYFEGRKIATSYPAILRNYFREKNVNCEIREIAGSVEISPAIGLADGIFDIVSSGSTLVSNRLKEVEVVMKSEALLIGNKNLCDEKKEILRELLFRMDAVKTAEDKKYVLMNAPEEKLEEIVAVLPGMKSPTVMPLAQKGWCSVHTVLDEKCFWEIIGKLKALGAEGILVLPIEKMII